MVVGVEGDASSSHPPYLLQPRMGVFAHCGHVAWRPELVLELVGMLIVRQQLSCFW